MKNCSYLSVVVFSSIFFVTFELNAAPAGILHHWNFDEGPDWHDDAFLSLCQKTVAADSVGQTDLSLQNMGSDAWVSGREFTCLEFDGINDYALAASDLAEVLGKTSSLVFWVKTTQAGNSAGTESGGVTGVVEAGGINDIQWGWIDDSGKIALSAGDSVVTRSSAAVNDGKWHHVAITRNTTTGIGEIYVDGKLSDSGTGTAGDITTAFGSIGRIEDTAGTPKYFEGRLDGVYVFDRVINSATVNQLMNNHAPKVWDTMTQGTTDKSFSTESVLFKAYDAEQDELSVSDFKQPAHGSVVYNGDGTFEYTAENGYSGADSFETLIEDGNGGFATAVMNLIVLSSPDAESSKRTTTFVNLNAIDAGDSPLQLNGWRCPRAIDWESDGDMDVIIGHGGKIWLYINTGSASTAIFASGVRVQANGADISLAGSVTITFADMTGDGIDDLVAIDSGRKVRVYRNTSAVSEVPVFEAAFFVKTPGGSDFILSDQRFDAGDWDGDGLCDIVTGTWASEVRAYKNVGTASQAKYDTNEYEVLMSGAYNLYPRLFDISRNGVLDLIRGINWGSITYWFDPLLKDGLGSSGNLVITDSSGANVDMKPITDGAIVDFADFNGDGVLDLLSGGHYSDRIYIGYGRSRTVADCLAENEAIYNAHPSDLGAALEANDQMLLNQINGNSREIISHMQAATLPEREEMFDVVAAHVGKYSFLQMNAALDTNIYHHVPSIAGQNLLTMHQMFPDSPTHRQNVADAVGLTGLHREIYLNSSMHVGDNQNGTQGQLESVRDFMKYQPRPIYPDTMLTLNHYRGDGRGGHVNSFTGAKNTFDFGQGNDADEWAADLDSAIQFVFGTNSHRGDYFTLVMGHEATHSLDGYVRARANENLERRWGQMLVLAGGPDIVAASSDWIDWNATKAHFQAKGYWDGDSTTWTTSWDAYWATGPGSVWNNISFMRGNIGWFFNAPQESLATQGNHRWMHSEGRLVGAIDRWRRGIEQSIDPMKANITEVTTFLDFVSAGLNKVVMYDTHGVSSPYPHATYAITRAWLERNDMGYITRIQAGEHVYEFTVDEGGVVTDVRTNIFRVNDDVFSAFENTTNCFDVLKNDSRLESGRCKLIGFTQPSHGILRQVGDGKLIYTPDKGYLGSDSFTYTAGFDGAVKPATVTVSVLKSQGVVMETYTGIGGDSISNLKGSTKFPDSPDEIAIQSTFECPADRMDTYGVRMKAWLKPPVTGSYMFWIASDDNGELWLSSDMDPVNASLIASVPGWTDPRQWNKFTEQQSSPVELEAGKYYYIEALMKEVGGKDNLSVAWQGTNITQQVINGLYLKPFVGLHDGFDGLSDWGRFSSRWMDTDCSDFPACSGSDLDNNLDVNYWDLMIFLNNWLLLQ